MVYKNPHNEPSSKRGIITIICLSSLGVCLRCGQYTLLTNYIIAETTCCPSFLLTLHHSPPRRLTNIGRILPPIERKGKVRRWKSRAFCLCSLTGGPWEEQFQQRRQKDVGFIKTFILCRARNIIPLLRMNKCVVLAMNPIRFVASWCSNFVTFLSRIIDSWSGGVTTPPTYCMSKVSHTTVLLLLDELYN